MENEHCFNFKIKQVFLKALEDLLYFPISLLPLFISYVFDFSYHRSIKTTLEQFTQVKSSYIQNHQNSNESLKSIKESLLQNLLSRCDCIQINEYAFVLYSKNELWTINLILKEREEVEVQYHCCHIVNLTIRHVWVSNQNFYVHYINARNLNQSMLFEYCPIRLHHYKVLFKLEKKYPLHLEPFVENSKFVLVKFMNEESTRCIYFQLFNLLTELFHTIPYVKYIDLGSGSYFDYPHFVMLPNDELLFIRRGYIAGKSTLFLINLYERTSSLLETNFFPPTIHIFGPHVIMKQTSPRDFAYLL